MKGLSVKDLQISNEEYRTILEYRRLYDDKRVRVEGSCTQSAPHPSTSTMKLRAVIGFCDIKDERAQRKRLDQQ